MEPRIILKDSAYEYIKEKILNCEILPGQAISEREIMETLSLGRTPVREALIMLQGEALVETFPRKGTIATPITTQSVLELFGLRKLLEPAVTIQNLHKINLTKLMEYDAKLKRVCSLPLETGIIPFYKQDIAFHEFLISCSGNSRLIGVCNPLFLEGYRIGMYGAKTNHSSSRDQTYTQHHAIVQAILEEDPVLVRNTFIAHLNAAQISALTSVQDGLISFPIS